MGRRSMGMPFALVALAGALMLGACESEEAPPRPSGTSTARVSSASPSPSASAASPSASVASEVPPAARQKSEKGAEAFVRFFFDEFNRAWTQPKAGLISRLAADGCEFCAKTETTAAYLVKEKQQYESEPVTVDRLEPFTGAPDDQRYFALALTQNASRILDESGTVVATDPKKATQFNVAVRWAQGRWSLLGVENAK